MDTITIKYNVEKTREKYNPDQGDIIPGGPLVTAGYFSTTGFRAEKLTSTVNTK